MKRFGCKRAKLPFSGLLLSILLFIGIVLLLLLGMQSLEKRTLKEQKNSLERALNRSVVECYAAEGAYPQSLSYLKQYYHLSYDPAVFFVDYQPVGENILPEITVIQRGG